MGQRYLARSMNALTLTKNWFGKLVLLSLIALILLFGPVVVAGYLFGWARDAAWGMENPLPSRIFGNEDGMLYRRGLYAFVIMFVVSLALSLVMGFVGALEGSTYFEWAPWHSRWFAGSVGFVTAALGLLVGVASTLIAWACVMRMTIYNTLHSGFQFKRIAAMLRKDIVGLLKVYGMQLFLWLVVGALLATVWVIVVFACACAFLPAVGAAGAGSSGDAVAGSVVVACAVAGLLVTLAAGVTLVGFVFVEALVCRALGYWMAQFDIVAWGTQDDLLPCEVVRNEAE